MSEDSTRVRNDVYEFIGNNIINPEIMMLFFPLFDLQDSDQDIDSNKTLDTLNPEMTEQNKPNTIQQFNLITNSPSTSQSIVLLIKNITQDTIEQSIQKIAKNVSQILKKEFKLMFQDVQISERGDNIMKANPIQETNKKEEEDNKNLSQDKAIQGSAQKYSKIEEEERVLKIKFTKYKQCQKNKILRYFQSKIGKTQQLDSIFRSQFFKKVKLLSSIKKIIHELFIYGIRQKLTTTQIHQIICCFIRLISSNQITLNQQNLQEVSFVFVKSAREFFLLKSDKPYTQRLSEMLKIKKVQFNLELNEYLFIMESLHLINQIFNTQIRFNWPQKVRYPTIQLSLILCMDDINLFDIFCLGTYVLTNSLREKKFQNILGVFNDQQIYREWLGIQEQFSNIYNDIRQEAKELN